jgi:hypothetical protein
VRFAAQLMQRTNGGMIVGEVDQEVAHSARVLACRIRSKRGSKGLDGLPELESQRMFNGSVSGKLHDLVAGTGRMCCATARAYC